MTWFKVDDSFHSHPKVMAVDPAAIGLWTIAGSWCSAGLTDGFVPDYALPRLAPGAVRLAAKLVAAGLWVRVEGGYQFHDWLQANPTAESEKDRKAKTAKRQREFRERRNALRDASRNGPTNTVTNDAPSRPVPSGTTYVVPEAHVGQRARTEPRGASGPNAADAKRLVAANVGAEFPAAIRTSLAIQAAELLAEYEPDTIAAALAEWKTRTGIGPGVLPSIVADVVKRRNGHVRSPSRKPNADDTIAELLGTHSPLAIGGSS